MFSFPSEERERERERERDRETYAYELASVSLSFFLSYTYVVFFTFRFGEICILSFWREFFLFGESCTCLLNFEWTKRRRMLPLPSTFLFSLWTSFGTFKSFTTAGIFLYRFFFRSLLHLTSFRSPKKKKKKTSNMNVWHFSFHDPWTVIGTWTAIGDGPVIMDHCVVK